MAHKDYVARGRNPKKAPEPEKRPLPWARIVITLALVFGFGYFLWSINDKAEDPANKKDNAQAKQVDPLPEVPKEEWEFIKTLPEYSVEVEVEEQAASDKRYLMQCGSFRKQSQAEELKARIAFQGFEAQVRPSEGSSGRWYRVIIGPYESKRLAEKQRHTLQRAKINGCKIWLWNL
ncbi:MAG: cell division protein FtsN [Alteromonadaceae bacterium]|jgi:cell division protein FtsN|uniref:SPOR domain-containing protein n=1 Tax=Paraglaciecola mesophila TaxID=197222 RepID=A0ABU9SVY0_9ALTE|nr:cell division protein FtsN [Alteromonadaceae bacterium]MBB19503.1 cell division protein FtsN [Rickettsiales bacterium]